MGGVIQIVACMDRRQPAFRAKLYCDGKLIHTCGGAFRKQSDCLEMAMRLARETYGIETPCVRTGRQRV